MLALGVQGKNTAEMSEYARHAEELAPDALIAMPPSAGKSQNDYGEYFRALAKLTKRPVIIQSSGGARGLAPSVDLLVELASDFPHLGYIKEESSPLVERMLAEVRRRPPIRSVFGANFAEGWLYEMRLGLDGVITGNAMYADLMATMWKLHEQGKHDSGPGRLQQISVDAQFKPGGAGRRPLHHEETGRVQADHHQAGGWH